MKFEKSALKKNKTSLYRIHIEFKDFGNYRHA